MSVVSKNPFALLEEPEEAPTPPPATAPKESRQNDRNGNRNDRPRREPRNANASTEGDVTNARNFEGGRGGRGRGGKHAQRGERGSGRGGGGRGRVYDRHSADVRADSGKQAAHGWGAEDAEGELQNEVAAVTDAAKDAKEAAAEEGWGAGDAPAPTEDAAAAAPVDGAEEGKDGAYGRRRRNDEEEEDNTLSYAQYLEKKAAETESLVPKLELRKVGDGETEEKMFGKGAKKVTSEDREENYFAGKSKSAPKARAPKAQKEFLDIEARFEPPSSGRGGRGRGGRGRGRGDRDGYRGGRGGGRGGDRGAASVNVDDTTAFPSLS